MTRRRVLFLSKAKGVSSIDSLIESQGNSLQSKLEIEHVLVSGNGFYAYLKALATLKNRMKKKDISLIHAHYGMCGLVAILSFPKVPVVVSFMGSDLHGGNVKDIKGYFFFLINKVFSTVVQLFANQIIIKSQYLKKHILFKKKLNLIPNGVDISAFKPTNKLTASKSLNLSVIKQNILFLGSTTDQNKNFQLLRNTYLQYNLSESAYLINPYPIPAALINKFLNACDVLVLTSYKEGSPNVIKEAMSCNLPIVATDTGDVRWVIGDTAGCFICSYKPDDVAEKIKLALQFSIRHGRTNGRKRIVELGLDSESIATKITEVYNKLLNA